MKKNSLNLLAAALLACAFTSGASAQTPAAKSGEAVRERRATAERSGKKGAPAAEAGVVKEETPSKVESKVGAPATPEKPADEEPAAEAGASSVEGGAAAAGDDAEELRARLASVTGRAERARLQHALVDSLARSGRKSEAVALLRSMLAEERFDPPFFYNAGNALARLGESEAAADAYRKAVAQRRGSYARAQHNLGVVLTRLGRWDEAEEALTAALKIENYNYAEASYNLGRLHQLRGDYALAVAEWGRTLRLKPEHAVAAVALARALAGGGDAEAGLAVLDSFGERMKRRAAGVPREVTVARGEIVAASNVAAVGALEARTAGAGGGGVGVAGATSRSAAEDRDLSAILRGARKGGQDGPLVATKQAFELLRRARAARESDRAEEAASLYRRAIESNGGYFPPANLELGYTLSGLRRDEEAIKNLLVVIGREGAKYPLAFYHLGRFYEHVGRLAPAGEAFARAAELMGGQTPQFLIDLSRVREREGNYAEALAAATRYVQETEKSGGAPDWARARVARLQKKVEEGKTQAQATPEKN